MSKQSDSSSDATRRKSVRQYWRRSESPRAWWPWGLLSVLGLAVLFLFGALVTAPNIQAEVRTEVADRFINSGVTASVVRSDGQGINIRALAQTEDEVFLRALAKSTQCETWAGELTCPTTVSVLLSEPQKSTEASAPASVEKPAAVDVRPAVADPGCNDQFNEILSRTTVRFRSGSAAIDRGNENLLQRLAQTARTCPGKLVIDGYTDSRGPAGANEALSLARAQAVGDALIRLGIESDRVTARGFGELNPVADNETPDGRAKNRRIVITTNDLD